MNGDRRLAFARARTPVAVAMKGVAAALAASNRATGVRRSVFIGGRNRRRIGPRALSTQAAAPARGYEDLH